MKILIVEDDAFLLDAFSAELNDLGHTVRTVTQGDLVKQAVISFQPDIIILDLILPKKNGILVLKNLKQSEETKHIPVLIASNIDLQDTIDKAFALGAADYFIKSNSSIEQIVKKCETIVKNANHASSSPK